MKRLGLLQHTSKKFLFLSAVGVIPIVLFGVFTAIIGGEALSGKIDNGHYYVREGMPYKEVSFRAYVISASLCFAASVGFFLIANGVLRRLDEEGLLNSKRSLKTVLHVFFGFLSGCLAIASLVSLVHALSH